MIAEPAVQVRGLGKRYRIGGAPARPQGKGRALLDWALSPLAYLRRTARKARPEEIFWALKDVSFELGRGEVLGIVGRNGAGKSTLLKLLARITDPSEGEAVIRGRAGALLEVGTGFHPELTGRENIFLNGAILGMSRAEIAGKLDAIVDFAEGERFIDTAVKYYSSGMRVRLAFSVAAHLEPEILIVDEVLAVGDVGFQQKCVGKMGDVAGEGRTVLLVSHNMEAVLGLCPRAIWLEQGRLVADGPSGEVVERYVSRCLEMAGGQGGLGGDRTSGDGLITFTGFSLRDGQGHHLERAVCGDPLEVVLDYASKLDSPRNVTVWFWVRNQLGGQLLCFWSRLSGQDFDSLPRTGTLVCRIPKLPLAPGSYLLDLSARVGKERPDKITGAAKLEVVPGDFFRSGSPIQRVGEVLCEQAWRLEG